MVKHKPGESPPFVPRKPADWILWGTFTLARYYETAVEGIRRFQCSNPDCGKETVINPKNTWLPPRCMYCGEEFDWEGIFIDTRKICPKCGVEGYPITANFCVFHGSEKIPLQEKEYRKQ